MPRRASSRRSDSVRSAPCRSHEPDDEPRGAERLRHADRGRAGGAAPGNAQRLLRPPPVDRRARTEPRRAGERAAGSPRRPPRSSRRPSRRGPPGGRRRPGLLRRRTAREAGRGATAGVTRTARSAPGGRAQACAPKARCTRKPSSSYRRCARSLSDRDGQRGAREALLAKGAERRGDERRPEPAALRLGGDRDLADVPVRAREAARDQHPDRAPRPLGEARGLGVEPAAARAHDERVHERAAGGRRRVREVERGVHAADVAAVDDLRRRREVVAPERPQRDARGQRGLRRRQGLREIAPHVVARAPGEAGPVESRVRGRGGAEERLALHPTATPLRARVGDHRVHQLLLEPPAPLLAAGEDRADDDAGRRRPCSSCRRRRARRRSPPGRRGCRARSRPRPRRAPRRSPSRARRPRARPPRRAGGGARAARPHAGGACAPRLRFASASRNARSRSSSAAASARNSRPARNAQGRAGKRVAVDRGLRHPRLGPQHAVGQVDARGRRRHRRRGSPRCARGSPRGSGRRPAPGAPVGRRSSPAGRPGRARAGARLGRRGSSARRDSSRGRF